MDVTASQPGLREFVRQLRVIAAARDVTRLGPLLTDLVWSYEGGTPPESLLDDMASSDSHYWDMLRTQLTRGFAPLPGATGVLCAPWMAGRIPYAGDDVRHYGVIGSRVRVRSAGRFDAPVVAFASYDVVTMLTGSVLVRRGVRGASDLTWEKVRLPDGVEGWILSRYLWYQGDDVCVEHIEGRWRVRGIGFGD